MQWLIDTASWVFGDGLSPDERRAQIIGQIVMHGTPGRRQFDNAPVALSRDESSIYQSVMSGNPERRLFDTALAGQRQAPPGDRDHDHDDDERTKFAHQGFFVLVTNREQWDQTCGDYPRAGLVREPIYRDVDSIDVIGEQIITDGTIVKYARQHIDDAGRKMPGFHDMFFDEDALLVYVHASHLGRRVEYTRSGAAYLAEPMNKTRDPFVVFKAAAVIETSPHNHCGLYSYYIVKPDESIVLVPAYNRECARLGKKPVEI